MKSYDVIVLGNGSGSSIVENALMHGASVALIDMPPIGGTCQNFGCIPSKMLMYPADVIMQTKEADTLGIDATIDHVDFESIMDRMRTVRKESQAYQLKGINDVSDLDYYQGQASFTKEYTIKVNDILIRGKKIFIGTGARPLIPPIEGINGIDYLTNESLLELQKQPDSLIIIGGGYIAVEYAHFFSAIGTNVTILEQGNKLIPQEEPEISDLLTRELSKRVDIRTHLEVVKVSNKNDSIQVTGKKTDSDEIESLTAEHVLVATGRTSNADRLQVDKSGIEVDEQGYIKVDEYMQTSQSNIWAFGDAIGKEMFKHVANEEAHIAGNNAFHDEKLKMSYHAAPHAIYSYPQIASVGLTKQQAENQHYDLLVGTATYDQVAKGQAMMEKKSFAKAIINKEDFRILGFHVIGPYAPIVIQEVITIMQLKGQVGHIGQSMHIHPALPEIIQRTFANLEEV